MTSHLCETDYIRIILIPAQIERRILPPDYKYEKKNCWHSGHEFTHTFLYWLLVLILRRKKLIHLFTCDDFLRHFPSFYRIGWLLELAIQICVA